MPLRAEGEAHERAVFDVRQRSLVTGTSVTLLASDMAAPLASAPAADLARTLRANPDPSRPRAPRGHVPAYDPAVAIAAAGGPG